jgi:hypothetical protein
MMTYYIKHSTENKYLSFGQYTIDSTFIACLEYYLKKSSALFNEKEKQIAQKWVSLYPKFSLEKSSYSYVQKIEFLGEVDSYHYSIIFPVNFNINSNEPSCRLNDSQLKDFQSNLDLIIDFAKTTEQLKKAIQKYFSKSNARSYDSFEYVMCSLDMPFSKATMKEILYLQSNFNPVEVSFSTDYLSKSAYVSYVKESYGEAREGFFSKKNSYGNLILSNLSQAKLYDSIDILKREIGYLNGSILEVHVEVKKVITNQDNNPNLEKAVAILEKEKLEKVLESYNDEEIQSTFEKIQKKRNKI